MEGPPDPYFGGQAPARGVEGYRYCHHLLRRDGHSVLLLYRSGSDRRGGGVWGGGRKARHRHGLSPAADAPRLQDARSGSSISSRCAARSRSKAGRSSGSPRTAFIISIPITKAIRTRRAKAPTGRTWAGSSPARRCITTPRCCAATCPDLSKDPFHVALDHVALGVAGGRRPRAARVRRHGPTCCGASSSAPTFGLHAPGW